MASSTTIRVPQEFREQLRQVSEKRGATLTDTLIDALEALRREDFFAAMTKWESEFRKDKESWDAYEAEAEAWAGDLDDLRSTDHE